MVDHVRADLPISESEAPLPLNTATSRTLRTFKGEHFTVSVREERRNRRRNLFIEARGNAGAEQPALFTLPDCTTEQAVELSTLYVKASDFALLVKLYGEELVQRYWGEDAGAPSMD